MESLIKNLLFLSETSIQDNRNEKEDLLKHIVSIDSKLTKVFLYNSNLIAAVNYFNNIMTSYINESETEYLFFERVIKYLRYLLDNLDKVDEDILRDIDKKMDEIEGLFISRTESTVHVVMRYDDIIKSGILTDSNYFIYNYAYRCNEEQKKRLLSGIPEV